MIPLLGSAFPVMFTCCESHPNLAQNQWKVLHHLQSTWDFITFILFSLHEQSCSHLSLHISAGCWILLRRAAREQEFSPANTPFLKAHSLFLESVQFLPLFSYQAFTPGSVPCAGGRIYLRSRQTGKELSPGNSALCCSE